MNGYMLQRRDGQGYRRSNRELVNHLIKTGEVEWVGTDYDENKMAVVHYADWRTE